MHDERAERWARLALRAVWWEALTAGVVLTLTTMWALFMAAPTIVDVTCVLGLCLVVVLFLAVDHLLVQLRDAEVAAGSGR